MSISVFQIISAKIRPYQHAITVLIVLAIFMIFAFYGYKWFLKTKNQKEFSDVANTPYNKSTVNFYLFYADWCPHCVKCKPDWDKFSDEYNGKIVNGFKINCEAVDCSDKVPEDKAAKFNVTSFPTVKAVKQDDMGSNVTIDYEAKVTYGNLEKFVKTICA